MFYKEYNRGKILEVNFSQTKFNAFFKNISIIHNYKLTQALYKERAKIEEDLSKLVGDSERPNYQDIAVRIQTCPENPGFIIQGDRSKN